MKKWIRSITSLLVLGVLVSAWSSMAFARFYLSPVDPDESWLMITGAPGETVSDEFLLANDEENANTYQLTITDAESTVEEDGFFALTTASSEQHEIGAWASSPTETLTLEPGESRTLSVTLTIPEDTELKEYWGGITAMQTTEDADETSGIAVEVRNGLRIYLTVVSQEEFQAMNESPQNEDSSIFDYQTYILTGLVIVACALIVTFASHRHRKCCTKKGKRRTKKRKS